MATRLQDGKVLVAGGWNDDHTAFRATTEVYDPAAGEWTAGEDMPAERSHGELITLQDGRVLAVGGARPNQGTVPAEIYNPTSGDWTEVAGQLFFSTQNTRSVLLPDGRVLAVDTTQAAVFDPATDSWTPTGAPAAERYSASLTVLDDGRVLLAGGESNDQAFATVEVWDPVSGQWSAGQPMTGARQAHTATLLADGRLLVAGGYYEEGETLLTLRSAEIYDPELDAWTPATDLQAARGSATATRLEDGRVLIVGGGAFEAPLEVGAEIYDPVTDAWYATREPGRIRIGHTATILEDGSVLIGGGDALAVASAELFQLTADTLFEGWTELPEWGGPGLEGAQAITAYLDSRVTPAAWVSIARYDGVDWQVTFADPPLPSFNTLEAIDEAEGYWVFAAEEASLLY
jgi:N-acetylneuraminic acid mutarotase